MIDLSARAKETYSIKLEDGKIIKLKKPTQSLLMKMMELTSSYQEEAPETFLPYLFEVMTDIFNRNTELRKFTVAEIGEMLDVEVAVIILDDYLKSAVKAAGGIVIPSSPSNDEVKEYLITQTDDIKLVADYTHINFNEILELDCLTFKALLRDAFIDKMRKTKEGQEFLEDCWILTQTKPDRNSLRNNYN